MTAIPKINFLRVYWCKPAPHPILRYFFHTFFLCLTSFSNLVGNSYAKFILDIKVCFTREKSNLHSNTVNSQNTLSPIVLLNWLFSTSQHMTNTFLNYVSHRLTTSFFRNSFTVKKWGFPLKTSSVNLIKSSVSCGFGHIYWRNFLWKSLFFYSEWVV